MNAPTAHGSTKKQKVRFEVGMPDQEPHAIVLQPRALTFIDAAILSWLVYHNHETFQEPQQVESLLYKYILQATRDAHDAHPSPATLAMLAYLNAIGSLTAQKWLLHSQGQRLLPFTAREVLAYHQESLVANSSESSTDVVGRMLRARWQ